MCILVKTLPTGPAGGRSDANLEGRSKEERAQQRQNLGTLKQLAIQPKTRKRYQAAREKFYAYLQENHLDLPRNLCV